MFQAQLVHWSFRCMSHEIDIKRICAELVAAGVAIAEIRFDNQSPLVLLRSDTYEEFNPYLPCTVGNTLVSVPSAVSPQLRCSGERMSAKTCEFLMLTPLANQTDKLFDELVAWLEAAKAVRSRKVRTTVKGYKP